MTGVEEATQSPNSTGDSQHVPEVIDQPRYDKSAWLGGATDLEEAEVFVEAINGYVKIRGLSAGKLAYIQTQCLSNKGNVTKVDMQRQGNLKFAAGVVDPKFDEQEANQISQNFGPSFELVVSAIDELSGATEEDVNKAMRRFRPAR